MLQPQCHRVRMTVRESARTASGSERNGIKTVSVRPSFLGQKVRPRIFPLLFPVNANMELPTHQPLLAEDTDEDLSDEQIRELLNEAAVRMRAKAATAPPVSKSDAPFRLPKLQPGHIADTYEKTDGNITRLDHSKLVDKKQQALANGIKKIEDPLQIKKQKQEVRSSHTPCIRMPVMISIPNLLAEQTRAPSWLPSCTTEAPLVHSYTEALLHSSFIWHLVSNRANNFAQEKKATAGSQWFNMPKTDLTPELRRDLQLLKMRNVLDPKRHYKKDNKKGDVPAFSQVGTIIEGATEFYSSRLKNKDRKQTMLEEVIAQEQDTGRFKRKYEDIQTAKASGKKAHYKALKAKRNKGKVVKP